MSLPSKYLLWYHDVLPPLAVSPVVIFFHEREQDKNQRDNTVEQSLTHELVRKAKNLEAWPPPEKLFSLLLLGAPHLIEKSFQAVLVLQ